MGEPDRAAGHFRESLYPGVAVSCDMEIKLNENAVAFGKEHLSLDLTRLILCPFCALIPADLGVEVIKIEELGVGDYEH